MISSEISYGELAGASRIINFISSDTLPEEFDEIRIEQEQMGYRLEFGDKWGYNALGTAVIFSNIPLIRHIVAIGGKHLLNYANLKGDTPLHLAAKNDDYEKAYEIAQELIQLGSKINLDTPFRKDYTPLMTAVRSGNIELARLLLRNNAIIPNYSEELFNKDKRCFPHINLTFEQANECLQKAKSITKIKRAEQE